MTADTILRAIVATADLIATDGATVLVAPLADDVLDDLAAFDAEREDLEWSVGPGDLERQDGDDEPSLGTVDCVNQTLSYVGDATDREHQDGDDEPSLGTGHDIDQRGWGQPARRGDDREADVVSAA